VSFDCKDNGRGWFRPRKSSKFQDPLIALMATPTKGTVQKLTDSGNCNERRNIGLQLNKECKTPGASIADERERLSVSV
jgi:hypothetical protein